MNPARAGSGRHPYDALSLEDLRARRSVKWRRYPPDVLPAWVAEMDFPLAPPVAAALAELVDRGDTGYATAGGLPEAVAAFAAERYGASIDPSRVYLVQDVMRGVLVTLELFTAPGDGVVVNPPVYPPFFSTIRYAGRRVVEAPLARGADGRHQLDLEVLEHAFRDGARAYLLCNPHNPTGRVFTRQELEQAATLADRYQVTVLADEVHAPLTYPGARHVPFASLDAGAARRSVTFVSASKAWNLPGLKCAVMVAHADETRQAFDRLPEEISYGAGIMGVVGNEVAFREGRPWLDDTIGYLDGNRRLLADLLARHLPEVRFAPPEATYLAWLDCSALGLGDDPAGVFLERGRVAVRPGPAFGTQGTGYVRLNFATGRSILSEAVARMARALPAGPGSG